MPRLARTIAGLPALLMVICGSGVSGKEAWVPDFTTEVIPLGEYAQNSGRAVFTDDRNHIMDVIGVGISSRVFLDGRIAPGCDQLDASMVMMSADGSCFVCRGSVDRRMALVANGKVFRDVIPGLEGPIVSPKGGRWACAFTNEKKQGLY